MPEQEETIKPSILESKPLDELEDSDFSLEDIMDLKLLSLSKPKNLAQHRWNIDHTVYNPKQKLLMKLVKEGHTVGLIAGATGYSESMVNRFLVSPAFQQATASLQGLATDPRKRIEQLSIRAVEAVEGIMDSPGERGQVRLAAATYLLDQVIGKAKQEVSIQNNTMVEVIQRIEQLSSRPVSELRNLLAPPPDPMDDIVNALVPDNIVIGKRTTNEEENI